MNLFNSQIRWITLSILVIIIDSISKWHISNILKYENPVKITITSFLNLTLFHNYGAAFSLLNNPNKTWQIYFLIIISSIISIIIIIWLIILPRKKNTYLMGIGLSLILGGALGNLYDRFMYGYVVDFLDFYIYQNHFPAFNFSDSAIFIGTNIIIIKNLVDLFSKTD